MRKYWKKIWAMAACASIVLAATACGRPSNDNTGAEEIPGATDAAEPNGDAGFQAEVEDSKDGIMRIASSSDLVTFRERVEGGEIALGAVLTEDIDMSDICGEAAGSWKPITQYAGTFDGDNHAIKNLYINEPEGCAGLFGNALEGSLLKNVVMEGFRITSAETAGSLAGVCRGTVENCHSNGQLTATGKVSGGLCGIGEIMTGCSNHGTVIGVDTTVGGVAGEINGTIEKCWNEGTVEGTGNYAGGVVGRLTEDINHGKLQVFATDCYNTGKVTNEAHSAGGVAGYADTFVINRCYNLGEVSGLAYVGGIIACGASESKADAGSVIENCYNKGRIAAINWAGAFKYGKSFVTGQSASGIADAMNGCIANCYNHGEVSVSAVNPLEGSATGIGDAIIIANSYAHGSLVAAEDSMKNGIGCLSTTQNNISVFYLEGTENGEPGSPEASFTDGSMLSGLQSFSPDSIEDASYRLELSAWVQGEDGMPHFDWE